MIETTSIPSPGLTPGPCRNCAESEAQVDRLASALQCEAKSREVMAQGLYDAHAEIDRLRSKLAKSQEEVMRLHNMLLGVTR